MADSHFTSHLGNGIRRTLITWALPRIKSLNPGEWNDALKRARDTNFDWVEQAWVFASLALTTYLLRFDVEHAATLSLPVQYLIQFLAAVPILTLLAGPVYLRCMRRGLDRVLERRQIAGQSDPLRRQHHD